MDGTSICIEARRIYQAATENAAKSGEAALLVAKMDALILAEGWLGTKFSSHEIDCVKDGDSFVDMIAAHQAIVCP